MYEQRKGRARSDGEFVVFVKDRSPEKRLYKASLVKGESAYKALERAATNMTQAKVVSLATVVRHRSGRQAKMCLFKLLHWHPVLNKRNLRI